MDQRRKQIIEWVDLLAQLRCGAQMTEFSQQRRWLLLKLAMLSSNVVIFSNPKSVEKFRPSK